MFRWILVSCISLWSADAIIYIDRYTLDFDEKLCNWSVSYFHDEKGNSVSSVTIKTFATFTKLLIYVNARVAEDQNDKEFRREVVRTVIDFGKFMENTQANPILKVFLNGLQKGIRFKVAYPMPPATYRIVNVSYDALFLPFDVKGSVDFRLVGRVQGQPKMNFLTQLNFYGGFLIR